jgi:molybdopterin/thiamine biosynthesis adenylyltransferase
MTNDGMTKECRMPNDERYSRQVLLPWVGERGQQRLAAARVVIVGCGALGGTATEQLARAGVGHIRIIDRDVVELSNLQRQVLFDEEDARLHLPKAVAARNRLGRINSTIEVEAVVADLNSDNVDDILGEAELILDGTDNAETRYLINDAAVKLGIPWIYAACVGTEGRVMAVMPGSSPCLRCLFPQPPAQGELATCDTAGVLGPAASVAASIQAGLAIRMIVGEEVEPGIVVFDVAVSRFARVAQEAGRREDCICCGRREFEFLKGDRESRAVSLCGRNSVQIRPAIGSVAPQLSEVKKRLEAVGRVETSEFLLRCALNDPSGVSLTVFRDGRLLVHGVDEPQRARSIVARCLG